MAYGQDFEWIRKLGDPFFAAGTWGYEFGWDDQQELAIENYGRGWDPPRDEISFQLGPGVADAPLYGPPVLESGGSVVGSVAPDGEVTLHPGGIDASDLPAGHESIYNDRLNPDDYSLGTPVSRSRFGRGRSRIDDTVPADIGDVGPGAIQDPVSIEPELEGDTEGTDTQLGGIGMALGPIFAGIGKAVGSVVRTGSQDWVFDTGIEIIDNLVGGGGPPTVIGNGGTLIRGTSNGCGPCAGVGDEMGTFRKAVRQTVINRTGRCMSHKAIRAVAKEMGIANAAPCLGLDPCDLAIYYANPPKTRRRGITSRQISAAANTARRVQSAHDRLSKKTPSRSRTRIGK